MKSILESNLGNLSDNLAQSKVGSVQDQTQQQIIAGKYNWVVEIVQVESRSQSQILW